mgnify:CR=1 FL=1
MSECESALFDIEILRYTIRAHQDVAVLVATTIKDAVTHPEVIEANRDAFREALEVYRLSILAVAETRDKMLDAVTSAIEECSKAGMTLQQIAERIKKALGIV